MAPPSRMGPGWVRGLNYTRHTPLRARLAPFLAVFSDSYKRPQRPGVGTVRDPPGRGRLGAAALLGLGAFLSLGRRVPLGAPHGHSSSSSKTRFREPKKCGPRIIAIS